MSWLFLFACRPSRDIEAHRLQRIHDAASAQLRRPAFYLAAGGLPATCLHGEREDGEGWAVTGIGIEASETEHAVLDAVDWARLLDEPEDRLDALDGHFAGVCWSGHELRCFVDAIGLRSLYFASTPDGLCVSTRLDWVARATGRNAVDFRALEGRWTMYNQIGYGSGIVGINRLGPGGRLHVLGGRAVVCRERNSGHPHFATRHPRALTIVHRPSSNMMAHAKAQSRQESTCSTHNAARITQHASRSTLLILPLHRRPTL